MSREQLWEAFAPVIPEAWEPVVERSIRDVGKLPGVRDWKPERVDQFEALRIASWGFPLQFLEGLESLDRLRTRMGESIRRSGEPDPSVLSEIQLAGLVAATGASSLEHVQVGDQRTPDFMSGWGDDVAEIEVTCKTEKAEHIRIRDLASSIAKRIHNRGSRHDTIVHVAGDVSPEVVDAIAVAASKLDVGSLKEAPGHWRVKSVAIERRPHVILTVGQFPEAPAWWPRKLIRSFVFHGSLAPRGAKQAPPQTRVYFGLPLTAYINPVERKASRL